MRDWCTLELAPFTHGENPSAAICRKWWHQEKEQQRGNLSDKWIPYTPNQAVVFSGNAAEDARILRGPCVSDQIFLPEAWIRATQELRFHLYQSILVLDWTSTAVWLEAKSLKAYCVHLCAWLCTIGMCLDIKQRYSAGVCSRRTYCWMKGMNSPFSLPDWRNGTLVTQDESSQVCLC